MSMKIGMLAASADSLSQGPHRFIPRKGIVFLARSRHCRRVLDFRLFGDEHVRQD